jgi:hypothetical protein
VERGELENLTRDGVIILKYILNEQVGDFKCIALARDRDNWWVLFDAAMKRHVS